MKLKMVQKRSFLKWLDKAEKIMLNVQVAQNFYVTHEITVGEAQGMVDWLNMDELVNAHQGRGNKNTIWIGDTMERRAG